jgi:hypothetical protein
LSAQTTASSPSLVACTLLLAIVAIVPATPATAGVGGSCAERFPAETFEWVLPAGPVTLYGSGIGEPMARRFAGEIEPLATWVDDEIGLDGVAVCVFDDELPLEDDEIGWHGAHTLRAAALGEEGLVVLSAFHAGTVAPGAHRGLIHVAQWRVSDGSYPVILADDVHGWYRNRLAGAVDAVHETYLRQNVGRREPWPPFPWMEGPRIPDTLLYDPEFRFGAGGDFTDFAVRRVGTSFLADPFSVDVAALDEAWRTSLFDESGAILGGSRGWIGGVIIVSGAILAAILMAYQGRRQRLKVEAELREGASRDAQRRRAALEEQSVRPLAPGLRRSDPRVRRTGSDSGVIDRDDGYRSPPRRGAGTALDEVSAGDETADDAFRHPGFDDDR